MLDDSQSINVFLCDNTNWKQTRRHLCPSPKGILLTDKTIYIPIIDEIILLAQVFADN